MINTDWVLRSYRQWQQGYEVSHEKVEEKRLSFDNGMLFDGDWVDRLGLRLEGHHRILFWGEMGVGKSTLALELVRSLSRKLSHCQILSLDPGTPPFGIPGSISRGWWSGQGLKWGDCQALCTLNAGRFRLPLVVAARRLLGVAEAVNEGGQIVIDPPGVVRGVGGGELLLALAESLNVGAVVALYRQGAPLTLTEELASLPVELIYIPASPEAKRPSSLERLKHRTNMWDRFLADSLEETFMLDRMHVLGTPPPREMPEVWADRQVALLNARGDTVRMGEVIRLTNGRLTVRMPPGKTVAPVGILIRDAGRNAGGNLKTIAHAGKTSVTRHEPGEIRPPTIAPNAGQTPLSIRVGPAWATLVGGILGDPLLHIRLRNLKQSFFFDLGDPAYLAVKVAHQVSAVFLSHAHIDHIGGLMWFLRARIGTLKPCKIFGPADTITRIENFLGAVTWDRIQDKGPLFEVCEFDGASLKRAKLQPGQQMAALPDLPIPDGIILAEAGFDIKAVVCDHNIPSVAYALDFRREINVRKERLASYGLSPGPWLNQLKQCIATEKPEAEIKLPNGAVRSAAELTDALTIIRPGKKIVYAADMADTPENRKKLINLARSAHTFFCESAFTIADKHKADATQHLTTLAAAEIARTAGVERFAPFHFSKRYEHDPGVIYNEIRAAAGPVKILGHFH